MTRPDRIGKTRWGAARLMRGSARVPPLTHGRTSPPIPAKGRSRLGPRTRRRLSMAPPTAPELAARLDRLPMTRHIWMLVTLISLGGWFELYDLFLTAYIAPGLVRAGYFKPESLGVFDILGPYGVAGVGTFVFALFAGLFIGAIFLGHFADRYGRRTVFTFSLIWYSITTAVMAFQTTGFGVDLWRFIAGVGIGIELVTIDTYVSELVPRTHRGRAYAFNQGFQFLIVPVMACIAYQLVPIAPFGFDGWRWVVLF